MQKLKVGYEYLIEFRIEKNSRSSYSPKEEILVLAEMGNHYKIEFQDSKSVQLIEKKFFFKKHENVSYGYLVLKCLS